MKVLRIKNLREVFYSIMRQFENGMKVSFFNLNNENIRYELIIGDISMVETDFDFIKIFSSLRKQIDAGNTIVVTVMDWIPFKISKDSMNPEYYIIDNAQILLNYMIFNSFFYTNVININVFDNKSKLLQKININMNNKIKEESRFYVDKISKYIDEIEKISTKINNLIYNLNEAKILITNDNCNIKLSLINI